MGRFWGSHSCFGGFLKASLAVLLHFVSDLIILHLSIPWANLCVFAEDCFHLGATIPSLAPLIFFGFRGLHGACHEAGKHQFCVCWLWAAQYPFHCYIQIWMAYFFGNSFLLLTSWLRYLPHHHLCRYLPSLCFCSPEATSFIWQLVLLLRLGHLLDFLVPSHDQRTSVYSWYSLPRRHWEKHCQSWLSYRNLQRNLSRPLSVCFLWREYDPCLGLEPECTLSTREEICWFMPRQFWFVYSDPYDQLPSHYQQDQWKKFL